MFYQKNHVYAYEVLEAKKSQSVTYFEYCPECIFERSVQLSPLFRVEDLTGAVMTATSAGHVRDGGFNDEVASD